MLTPLANADSVEIPVQVVIVVEKLSPRHPPRRHVWRRDVDGDEKKKKQKKRPWADETCFGMRIVVSSHAEGAEVVVRRMALLLLLQSDLVLHQ